MKKMQLQMYTKLNHFYQTVEITHKRATQLHNRTAFIAILICLFLQGIFEMLIVVSLFNKWHISP